MSFWPDVKKGDAYKPSASLENHVRHFFNGSANISDGKGSLKISNGNRVRVINNTSETIGAYEPIYITGRSNDPEQLDLYVAPATQDELLWGIAANTIEAYSDGAMIISGIAQAYITGTGEYASPGADGKLVAGSSGKALILHPGDDKTPGIVQLGYSAVGAVVADDYTGYFKIVRENETTISVVNGSDPSSEFCGTTDIPGAENVAKVSFTFDGSAFSIYLHAYKVDKNYLTIITDSDSDIVSFDARLIGSVSKNGKITQSIKTHETLSYRKDWYL